MNSSVPTVWKQSCGLLGSQSTSGGVSVFPSWWLELKHDTIFGNRLVYGSVLMDTAASPAAVLPFGPFSPSFMTLMDDGPCTVRCLFASLVLRP